MVSKLDLYVFFSEEGRGAGEPVACWFRRMFAVDQCFPAIPFGWLEFRYGDSDRAAPTSYSLWFLSLLPVPCHCSPSLRTGPHVTHRGHPRRGAP